MKLANRQSDLAQQFSRRYGRQPVAWLRAPGRVDLMGSHTDYNLGYVMTMAIDRDTWLAAAPRDDGQVHIYSANVDSGASFELAHIAHDQGVPWTNYVRGVADSLQKAGYELSGFDGLVHSTVPMSGGLSSSAALEVVTATTFNTLGQLNIDPLQVALMCQQAENEFVGLDCGILDQYSSVFGRDGHVMLLDCRDLTSTTTPIHQGIVVVICDTNAKRELTGSEYSERRAQCEQGARRLAEFLPGVGSLRDVSLADFERYESELAAIVAIRCRFIIEENQRVLDMATALENGDRARIGSLTAASYAGARDLYEIGSPEMEMMMKAMLSGPGIIGARQAGAGFGGCMVAFVNESSVESFAVRVAEAYRRRSGIEPQVYPVRASAGAGPFDVEA
jgi:galactokinase